MNIRYGKLFSWPRKIIKYILSLLFPIITKIYSLPRVESINSTLNKLILSESSISRFGDGEFLYIIDKLSLPFQSFNENLRSRLIEVLKSNQKNHLVGLPIGFHSLDDLFLKSKITWRSHIAWIYPRLYKFIDKDKLYYNSSVTRVYITIKDKSLSKKYFEKLRQLWDRREILIIEGEKSRLGVGNKLFSNSKKVKRIIGPAHNAYDKYNELLAEASKHHKNRLILIALGPAATVLSYDLANLGYQALDIGNIDIEYEWYLRGATSKVKIPGKYTSEAIGGRIVEDIFDSVYESQIIAKHL